LSDQEPRLYHCRAFTFQDGVLMCVTLRCVNVNPALQHKFFNSQKNILKLLLNIHFIKVIELFNIFLSN